MGNLYCMNTTTAYYPLVAIRNTVIFPHSTIPLAVGRTKSANAIKTAQSRGSHVVIVTQKNTRVEYPEREDLYTIGTLCRIDTVQAKDGQNLHVLFTGLERVKIDEFDSSGDHLAAKISSLPDTHSEEPLKTQALFTSLKNLAQEIVTLLPIAQDPLHKLIEKISDPIHLSYLSSSYLNISLEEKQSILETVITNERIEKVLVLMKKERELLFLQKGIQEKMSERLNKAQKDALLREQMRAIREELGEEGASVQNELSKKLEDAKLSPEAAKAAEEELKRLESLPPASAEYHVIRTYLDWLANMPWSTASADSIDLEYAKKVLDEDHYGLDSVKKRILQYLAVAKLKNNLRGPIICLVGPPGVGKTSIGQSIAKALGRKFIRTSLGGVRDEAEIRGHRRTYIGAMPGRLVQNIKRVGVNNPLLMLDEIDKLSHSFHGDPASAMLEVLDPEQNNTFTDHYLDVPFNLSNVFFVATANVIDTIPAPLRDRMEIIEISGYTTQEKRHIAKNHLLPKQLAEHGLEAHQINLRDDVLDTIIVNYTREAGVRDLSRRMATLCRYVAEQVVLGKTLPITIEPAELEEILGNERYRPENALRANRAGVVTGLAWTPVGGDILFIESSMMAGKGGLTLTGQLGDVMKESAQIAMSIARRALDKIAPQLEFDKKDFHIHVPSGAIPKDGPSAGIAILSSIVSLLINKAVSPKLAMTGEITLRGAVLPVGGIKEKILGAHRAGIESVILSSKNASDLKEVPEEVKSKMNFYFVETIEELLELALDLKLPKENPVASHELKRPEQSSGVSAPLH